MCCHCQVRQHTLHCDSQPIILDDFVIALYAPFLHPYLVSGIREDWRDILLSEPVTFFPLARNPKGKGGINTTLGRVGMKGASLSSYETPPPAQRQAGKLRVQTKESDILQGIDKPLPERIFPNKKRATKWLRVDISKRYK